MCAQGERIPCRRTVHSATRERNILGIIECPFFPSLSQGVCIRDMQRGGIETAWINRGEVSAQSLTLVKTKNIFNSISFSWFSIHLIGPLAFFCYRYINSLYFFLRLFAKRRETEDIFGRHGTHSPWIPRWWCWLGSPRQDLSALSECVFAELNTNK